jgi:hypothetical protein
LALLSQADYAKRRGCSEAAVNTARKQRIKAAEIISDGKVWIDAEKADSLWALNTRRRRADPKTVRERKPAGSTEPAKEARPPTDDELKAFIMGLPEDQIPDDVNESIRRKEHYNAERQRVAALKDRGEVGSVQEMEAAAFESARAVRDALLGLADRLAPMLAATTDTRECHRLLSEEHRIALRSLAGG